MSVPPAMAIAPEVAEALALGRPVVALESSVIAQGLPAPDNLEVARAAEAAVRAVGATPATVAILSGRLRVGLAPADLERLAQGGAAKANAGDLAVYLARGADAATTVSATVVAAARAGIGMFSTGGIGGVHRGESGDVSHDLVALARERVAVVCAGAKAVLDLPRTLEALESLGVPVVGYQTGELPAFQVRSSGLALEHRLDTPEEVAAFLRAHFHGLRQPGGALICQPVAEAVALEAGELARATAEAEAQALAQGIRGKAVTPFLLSAVARATGGRSVAANRALLVANARLAAAVAVAFAGA